MKLDPTRRECIHVYAIAIWHSSFNVDPSVESTIP
jgi:hypothetical protein